MRRLLSALLALSLLSGQSLLLPLHESQVARQEAGHHLSLAEQGDALAPADAHEHHEDSDCPVCLGAASVRLSPSSAAASQAPAASSPALSGRSLPRGPSPLLASAAPRGPPSAS